MAAPEPHRQLRRFIWLLAWLTVTVTFVPVLRLRARRWRRIPRKGGVLVVANHTTFFDPVLVSWATRRRTHGVGTDQILRVPVLGKIVPWLSLIAFAKGMKDKDAMRQIDERAGAGELVLLFPEGNRSWTGRMQPIKDSTGRLAKRLGVPVSFCRMTTAHFHWPRWARYPRFVPIEIEFLPPKVYPEHLSDAEVTEDIVRHIAVDPNTVQVPRFSFGFRLTWGLPKLLWACPSCFALGGIARQDNTHIRCAACGAAWRLDLACRLHATAGPAEDTTVDLAYHRVLDHFGPLPAADPERLAEEGLVLRGEAVRVERVHRGVITPEPLGEGVLTLYTDRLHFEAPGASFELPYAEVQAVLMQIGSRLQVRTEDDNYQISPSALSINLWKHFLSAHVRGAKAPG